MNFSADFCIYLLASVEDFHRKSLTSGWKMEAVIERGSNKQ